MNPAEPEKAPPGSVSAINPDAVPKIESLAGEYLEAIASTDPADPEFGRTVAALGRLGERDFVATAAMSGRLLDRRFHSMSGLLATRAPMARKLAELRKAASALDPARLKLGGTRPRRRELEDLSRYFERFTKARDRIEAILLALNEGREVLERDSAEISLQQVSLEHEMETLRQYAYLAERLDEGLEARIDAIAAADPGRADMLRIDVLTVVRRRRQEILTQLAIAHQGYAALEIVEQNNDEVVRAIAEATSSTAGALHTAVLVAQAAASQRLVLEQLEAARGASAAVAEEAAEMRAGLAAAAASGAGDRVAMLKQAWDEVFAALDRVDQQKAQALQTISAADRELTRPKS